MTKPESDELLAWMQREFDKQHFVAFDTEKWRYINGHPEQPCPQPHQ